MCCCIRKSDSQSPSSMQMRAMKCWFLRVGGRFSFTYSYTVTIIKGRKALPCLFLLFNEENKQVASFLCDRVRNRGESEKQKKRGSTITITASTLSPQHEAAIYETRLNSKCFFELWVGLFRALCTLP